MAVLAAGVGASSVWLHQSMPGAEAYSERISGTTVSIDMVPVLVPVRVEAASSAGEAGDRSGSPDASESDPDPESEPDPDPDPDPESEPEPDPDPESEPESSPATRTLWFSAHEITWDAFDAFLYRLDKPDPSVTDEFDALVQPSAAFVLADRGYGHSGYPAISVNHTAATSFCEWLSAKTGRVYRLPTQAEWEVACLAGDGSWIDSSRKGFADTGWVFQTSDRKTHPVGSLQANPFGLYDMLGNSAEWCVDPDGTAVLRGGSFRDPAKEVTAAHVQTPNPSWNVTDPQIPKSKWWLADADFAGFRIVCEGDAQPPAR